MDGIMKFETICDGFCYANKNVDEEWDIFFKFCSLNFI